MPRENTPIRTGLIGYGYAGKTLHAPLIAATPGLPLTVVGSSRPDAVHADFPGALVCAPELVPTHPDVDLVVIATTNEVHFPLAAAALRAGKHVVLDKPFTVTLAEARSLRDIATEHGRLLSVFHNRRWESETLGTRAMLASGRLGTVTHYECHMDRFRPAVRNRWREDPGIGAGLWFDLGPHLIDQALWLFGVPLSVNASIATLRPGGRTDDWAHVQLEYDGLRALLHATLLSSGGMPRTLLHGTQASWAKFGMDVQENQLKASMSPTDPAFGVDDDPGILYDGATGEQERIPVPHANQLRYYLGVRDAVHGDAPLPVTAHEAVAVMAILETTFESARLGKTLPVPLTDAERASLPCPVSRPIA